MSLPTLEDLRAADYEYRELPADFGDGEPEIVMRWFASIVGSDPPLRLRASFASEEDAMEYVADLKAGLIPRDLSFRPPPHDAEAQLAWHGRRLRARFAELEGEELGPDPTVRRQEEGTP